MLRFQFLKFKLFTDFHLRSKSVEKQYFPTDSEHFKKNGCFILIKTITCLRKKSGRIPKLSDSFSTNFTSMGCVFKKILLKTRLNSQEFRFSYVF